MSAELFDQRLRQARRDRAARTGPELFLLERAFEDVLERLSLVQRSFESALLIGCPDASWKERLAQRVPSVAVLEPGPMFAKQAGYMPQLEDDWAPAPASFDLCLAVGTLDTVNALPAVLGAILSCLRADGLLLGALPGGDSLPRLREAMHAADQLMRAASPHVHPRIDPPTLAALITASGFAMPVVDVDRVQVSYRSLHGLVSDLRRMGATNILTARSTRPLNRAAYHAAIRSFGGSDRPVTESFEILHFAGWAPGEGNAA